MKTPIEILCEKHNKEINALHCKQQKEIENLQNNCSHQYRDGASAIEEYCDDDDCDGFREPTFEVWVTCKLCNKEF